MEPHRRETEIALEVVTSALARSREGTGAVHVKGRRDLVTDTDIAIEDLIRARIEDSLGQVVIGEERGGHAGADDGYWLLDPICGTHNFASGIPLYGVNLALIERGEIVVAVVGDGSTGDVHVSERGHPPWTESAGRRRPAAAGIESEIVVVDSWPPAGVERQRAARFISHLIAGDRWDVRSLSTTVSLAYLAAGRVAACVLFATPALHAGPGAFLASTAGAVVTDVEGRPWTIDSQSVLAAASDGLHHALLAAWAETSPDTERGLSSTLG